MFHPTTSQLFVWGKASASPPRQAEKLRARNPPEFGFWGLNLKPQHSPQIPWKIFTWFTWEHPWKSSEPNHHVQVQFVNLQGCSVLKWWLCKGSGNDFRSSVALCRCLKFWCVSSCEYNDFPLVFEKKQIIYMLIGSVLILKQYSIVCVCGRIRVQNRNQDTSCWSQVDFCSRNLFALFNRPSLHRDVKHTVPFTGLLHRVAWTQRFMVCPWGCPVHQWERNKKIRKAEDVAWIWMDE